MKLERTTLSEQLYETIKQDIIEGRIEFGEKLTNRDLQEKYGVSSTPVRDAINRLYQDGLVENLTNSGARVALFDLQFILDVNEMLELLCCAAIEGASRHADKDRLCAQLEEVLLKQEQHLLTDDYYEWDRLYHQAYFDHCKNSQFQKNYSRYHVLQEMLTRRFHRFHRDHSEQVKEHRRIYEAYKLGDFERAVQMTTAHFEAAGKLFQKHFSDMLDAK